jgi:hypothetical protein
MLQWIVHSNEGWLVAQGAWRMATYRVIQPLTAFEPKEKRAFTIPAGSLIEKEESFVKLGVVDIESEGRVVLVQVQDLIERIEPG